MIEAVVRKSYAYSIYLFGAAMVVKLVTAEGLCGSDRHRTSISIDKNEAAVMNWFDVLPLCLNI